MCFVTDVFFFVIVDIKYVCTDFCVELYFEVLN